MGREVIAVVPAAGAGKRFGPGSDKTFAPLWGKPLIAWTLGLLQSSSPISEIILVLREKDIRLGEKIVKMHGLSKVRRIVTGGAERQDSVYNGLRRLKFIGEGNVTVLIHDGARPLVDGGLIKSAIEGLEGFDGAVLAVPPKDTIKEAGEDGAIRATLKRQSLWAIQTPQVFRYETLMAAYERAIKEGFYSTDDSALVERFGGRVRVVMGSYANIKITTPEDIEVAETFLKKLKS